MTDDEVVKLCLAAWNNVGLDHPTVTQWPTPDGTRRAWLRVADALLAAEREAFERLAAVYIDEGIRHDMMELKRKQQEG